MKRTGRRTRPPKRKKNAPKSAAVINKQKRAQAPKHRIEEQEEAESSHDEMEAPQQEEIPEDGTEIVTGYINTVPWLI